ncbi:choline-sulfatase [Marinobacterium mangrovicola]|uniref:Choline-sulfatase n=1 Tax=Marinobacterium mangrovicola TaxID=1476959 RepID=A0A4R1G3M8_9GAMM|nr:choline-sulfatase [Marinobacterium mangrovicola]TCK02577.1 choline-sulfatase [Marinobacterium mangrovicola]
MSANTDSQELCQANSNQAQPNILFIMADQLAAPTLSFLGGKTAKTPNLDRLAAEGVVFESAYCNSPLCAPSRYVLMTGQLPTKIGAWDNAADFPADYPTYAHYLRLRGYKTALSGKMHFCGPDQLHGFEQRLTTDIYPADYGWFVDWENFDTRPSYYHNMSSVTQAGPVLRSNQLDFDDEVVFQAQRYLYDRARSNDGQPFCLTVSMTHPHDPYATPPEYWDRYTDEEIELPSVNIADADQDPHSARLLHVYQKDEKQISEQQIRNARRAYYGNTSYVDDQIGKLMKILEQTGLADNTIVVFSGDHGDMLGERGLWYKMSYFEWSARVPMLVWSPKRFSPKRVSQSVATIDLLPTFVDLAGLSGQSFTPIEYAMPIDGRSLMPHLRGENGHDEVIGEYTGEGVVAPLFMIRRGDFKYVCCKGDPDQLFNLAEDPKELNNLADNSAFADTLEAFRQESAQRWDSDAITERVLVSQRRRKLIAQAHKQGVEPAWDHQPFTDASRSYMRNNIDLDDLEYNARFPRPNANEQKDAT